MAKVIIIFVLISGISFFVAKYFWAKVPTDNKIECEGGICKPSSEYEKRGGE